MNDCLCILKGQKQLQTLIINIYILLKYFVNAVFIEFPRKQSNLLTYKLNEAIIVSNAKLKGISVKIF